MSRPKVGYRCKTMESSESSSRNCLCRMVEVSYSQMSSAGRGGGQGDLRLPLQAPVPCQERSFGGERMSAYTAGRTSCLSSMSQGLLQRLSGCRGCSFCSTIKTPATARKRMLQEWQRVMASLVSTSLLWHIVLTVSIVLGCCQPCSKQDVNRTRTIPWRRKVTIRVQH